MRALAMMRAASEELLRSGSQSPLPAKKRPQKTARWTTLSAAVLVQSVAGLSYIFSLYSSTLKAKFHLPQTQLDLLGTLSNVGATVGLHMGMLTDRVGPRPVVALGACLGVAGWLPLWASLLEVLAGDGHGRIVGERLRDHLGVVKDPGCGTRPGRRAGVKSSNYRTRAGSTSYSWGAASLQLSKLA